MGARIGTTVAVVALSVGSWTACGGAYDEADPSRGDRDQPCFQNGTCFSDLVCFANRCIAASPEGGIGSSSTTSSGSSGSSSSSGNVEPSRDAMAACERQQACFPNTFKAQYASIDACVTEATIAETAPGANPTCFAQLKTAPCGELPTACVKGTLQLEATCDSGSQCVTSTCAKAAPAERCGACKAPKAENDRCGALDPICGVDLRCDLAANQCVNTLPLGADCSNGTAANCATGLVCHSEIRKCGKPRDIGGSCTAIAGTQVSVDCRTGLSCKDSTCEDVAPTFKEVGATCANTDRCKGKSSCVGGKCTAFATIGVECSLDTNSPLCDRGLACTNGVCMKFEYCK